MEDESRPTDEGTFLEKVDAAARSGRNVDRTYRVGDPEAPVAKRKASWIFGLIFILLGLGILELDFEATLMHKSLWGAFTAILFIAAGVRELLNWEAQR
jgi:hypothetical protein